MKKFITINPNLIFFFFCVGRAGGGWVPHRVSEIFK